MLPLHAKLPPLDSLPAERVRETYERLREAFRAAGEDFPPTSVVGSLVLGPLARVITAYEMSAECLVSDLDLSRLAEGNICDCDFAKRFLENFGVDISRSLPVITTLRLTFNTDKAYDIPVNTQFVFGDFHFFPVTGGGGYDVKVLPSGSPSAGPYEVPLTQLDVGVYAVTLPVYGPPASEVAEGTEALTDLAAPELISVNAAEEVVPNQPPSNIKDLAGYAMRIFPSGSLSTRGGTVSFVSTRFPRVTGVSPVLPGDTELTRATGNVFGVYNPVMDLYIKGRGNRRVWGASLVDLTYNPGDESWNGALTLDGVPVVLTGVHNSAAPSDVIVNQAYTVVSGTRDQANFPGLSGAYSSKELLGLTLPDSDFIQARKLTNTPTDTWVNGQDGMVLVDGDASISVSGQFVGNVFTRKVLQNIQLTFQSADSATLTDLDRDAVVGSVAFDSNEMDLTDSDPEVLAYLNGLSLTLIPGASVAGKTFRLRFRGETSRVLVGAWTDPAVREVEFLVNSPDVSPLFSTHVLGFRTAVVNSLEIKYRRQSGKYVDTALAREEIFNYVNDAGHPDVFMDSALHDIMLYAGAAGVRNAVVDLSIRFSPATEFSPDNSGGIQDANISIPSPSGSDWKVTEEASGLHSRIGERNVAFFMDSPSRITLTEVLP